MSLPNHIEGRLVSLPNSTGIGRIAPALVKAQGDMGNAVKGSSNPYFKSKYADLNSIREAVMPALAENGIAVLQPTVHLDGRNFVQTVLLHESGETYSGLTEIICAKQNDPQAQGSAISYARRYGLQSLLNVGAEDDDGESAMQRSKPAAKAVSTPTDQRRDAISKAQVAVAKKTATKAELLKALNASSDSITDAVNALSEEGLNKFLMIVEGKIK